MIDLNSHHIQQVAGGVSLFFSEQMNSYILMLTQGENFYIKTPKSNGSYMFFDDGDVLGPDDSFVDMSHHIMLNYMTYSIPADMFW